MKRHPAIHAFAAAGLFATAMSIAIASPPIPDLAYGGHGDGIARISVAGVPADFGYAQHAVAQADGSLVLVGTAATTSAQVVLARLDAHGLLDTGFGPEHDGFYRSGFAGNADDIAPTSDGKLVYLGHAANPLAAIVGRLHADGTPDTDFASNGQLLMWWQGDLTTVLPLPDGKILTLGWETGFSSCALRMFENGDLDPLFGYTDAGTYGGICLAPESTAGALSLALTGLVLADGRIRIAGYSRHPGSQGWDMSVLALHANGTLDTSFGPNHDGWAFVAFDQGGDWNDEAHAIAVDDAGRILLAGSFEGANGNDDIGIARLLYDGRPDPSFGSQGRVQVALDLGASNFDNAHSIAVLPDGGILVGATAYASGGGVSVALLLTSDGRLDPRFGDGGIFLQADPAAPSTAKVFSLQQILAGDYLYMVGTTLDAGNHLGFAATRAVMPLFADGFENPDRSRPAQP